MKKLAGFLLVVIFLGMGTASAQAADLSGWAWSGGDATPNSGFGWISFNSADAGAGGGPYKVSMNASGDLSGYAWSEHLGWISFEPADVSVCNIYSGGPGSQPPGSEYFVDEGSDWAITLTDFLNGVALYNTGVISPGEISMVQDLYEYPPGPTRSGQYHNVSYGLPHQAHVDTATGAVTGFAYAKAYGTDLDGCIELSGTNHASPDPSGLGGVTYDSGQFKGYAWGGDADLGYSFNTKAGPGWIQFNPSASSGVSCPTCVAAGVSGSCTTLPNPSTNLTSPANVTFTAVPSGGTGPYMYSWNGGPYGGTATDPGASPYTANGSGPVLKIRDNLGVESVNISCPNVTVAMGGSSALRIGRTVSEADTSNLTSLTLRQRNPFALSWSLTLSYDYSCSASVSPNIGPASWTLNWNNNPNWGNPSGGDPDPLTWDSDTGTTMKAGSASETVAPGVYQFKITCDSSEDPPNPQQTASVQLKVNSASETEI